MINILDRMEGFRKNARHFVVGKEGKERKEGKEEMGVRKNSRIGHTRSVMEPDIFNFSWIN